MITKKKETQHVLARTEKEVEYFVTSDGAKFYHEEEAIAHEKFKEAIDKIEFNSQGMKEAEDISCAGIYFWDGTEASRKILCEKFNVEVCPDKGQGWYFITKHDGGDSRDWVDLVPVTEWCAWAKKFIDELKTNKIVEEDKDK